MFECTAVLICLLSSVFVFFFNDTATTEIYTLSLHDALPICQPHRRGPPQRPPPGRELRERQPHRRPPPRSHLRQHHPLAPRDRKSTRLNSSHANISYAVFCLKKKNNTLKTCVVPTF